MGLSYIFTGKESLRVGPDEVGLIIQRCTSHDYSARYGSVLDLIAEVERLEVTPTQAPA